MEPGNFKVSLRTTDKLDATIVTKKFGGGGHVRAAGCNIEGGLQSVIDRLIAEIKKHL